jgi:hypothetical protein
MAIDQASAITHTANMNIAVEIDPMTTCVAASIAPNMMRVQATLVSAGIWNIVASSAWAPGIRMMRIPSA